VNDAARAYLTERGITEDVARAARLHAGEGEFRGRVLFPWLDSTGSEFYRSGRAINGAEPKWRHCKGPRPPLYASPGAWGARRVALVEGQIDALVCTQAGASAFAVSGSSLSDAATKILATKDEVVLALDADDAGRKLTQQAVERLWRDVRLYRAEMPPGCKDPGAVAQRAAKAGEDPKEAVAEILAVAPEVEPPVRLEALTAREVCELPDAGDADKVLGELLVRGSRVVLGAHTGHGKTTLALYMVKAVALAEEFLGYTGTGGRGLVIDAEQSLRSVKRKLAEVGLSRSDAVDYLRVPDGLALDHDDDEAVALEAVLARGYDVVVCDPLYKLHSGDSNAEREAVDLMKLFDAWREEYRFALVLPVHCRKPPVGAKFTMHEFFGSSAYLRGAEVVLGLQLLSEGYSRLHWFKDRDGDLPVGSSWGLLYDVEQGFRRDPNDGQKRQTAEDKIAELLESVPGMTIDQLVKISGYAERTVKAALKKLGAAGKSGPHNVKEWRLVLEGGE
jgi:hypothetical protein